MDSNQSNVDYRFISNETEQMIKWIKNMPSRNKNKINNPDLIFPKQLFILP